MTFDTRIQGIPCQVDVTYLEPLTPGRYFGPPEMCYPDEGGYVEYDILDRKGYKASWLEAKMTPDDHARVINEIWSSQ